MITHRCGSGPFIVCDIKASEIDGTIPALIIRLSRQRGLSERLCRLSKNIYVSALTAFFCFYVYNIIIQENCEGNLTRF